MEVRPRVEGPTRADYEEAEKFHDIGAQVYTDVQRKAITETAWKIYLARQTKQ